MIAWQGAPRIGRLILRLDRLRLLLWVGGITAIVVGSAASVRSAYPNQVAINSYAALVGSNPAVVAFTGPGYAMAHPNIGNVLVNEVQLWGMVGVALMSIFMLNRHTRAEEDVERADLLRSSVVGRHAVAVAAVAVITLANVVIALGCASGFILVRYDPIGSIALALSYLVIGWVFVGVTLVTAQVMSSGRATLGAASSVLGAMFVIRAVGDVGHHWVRWLSPLAWAQSGRAFAHEQWWPLVLVFGFGGALVATGFWLSTRRDIGSGMVATRLGPARAGLWIRRPIGLAFVQNRGLLIGWVVATLLTGIVYGSMGESISSMLEENEVFRQIAAPLGDVDLVDAYFGTAMVMVALITTGYAVTSVLRLHTEELTARAEPLLATPLSRLVWVTVHLVVSGVGTILVMLAAGIGTGIAYAGVTHDGGQVVRLVGAALVNVPAVLVFVGLAVLVFGWWPRAVATVWATLAVVTVVQILGAALHLPEWSRELSPFHHLPALPGAPMQWPPVIMVVLVAAGLGGLGVLGFRRRDLQFH